MRGNRCLLSMVLLVPAFTARASDTPLLIELEQRSAARPNGVSASGAVVVGGFGTGGGFYWMPTTGVIFIGGLAANSVSRDGSTIVGTVIDARHPGRGLGSRGGVAAARPAQAGRHAL